MPNKKTTSSAVPPRTSPLPYDTPRLSVYGSLTDITRAVGKSSNLDGGGGTMMRSAP